MQLTPNLLPVEEGYRRVSELHIDDEPFRRKIYPKKSLSVNPHPPIHHLLAEHLSALSLQTPCQGKGVENQNRFSPKVYAQ